MNNKKITSSIVSIATGASLLLALSVVPTITSAASLHTNAQVKGGVQLSDVITRSDAAIAKRLTSLNDLNTRIQDMKNVGATEKANISSEVQTATSQLTALKAKIDADTDVTVAINDEKTIYGSYRIYALVIPQGYIEAAADRVSTIVDMLAAISTKIQARITEEQTAGKDVTSVQATLSDLNARIANAKAQAATALSAVGSLVPDQGDKTKLEANTGALKSARANINTATEALRAAREDARTIFEHFKVSTTE